MDTTAGQDALTTGPAASKTCAALPRTRTDRTVTYRTEAQPTACALLYSTKYAADGLMLCAS